MFTSNYESAIDAKGRVSVPARFRAELDGSDRIFVWPSLKGHKCLEAGGDALMNYYRQILLRMSPSDPDRDAIIHVIFGRSAELKMDEPGRVKLPDSLLAHAGIDKQVLFVGALDRFLIFSPEGLAAYDAEKVAHAAAAMSKLDVPFQSALAAGTLTDALPRNRGDRS